MVQAVLGKPGVYLTLDQETGSDWVDAWTWPSDPQGVDAPPYHAADAARTPDSAPYQGAAVANYRCSVAN